MKVGKDNYAHAMSVKSLNQKLKKTWDIIMDTSFTNGVTKTTISKYEFKDSELLGSQEESHGIPKRSEDNEQNRHGKIRENGGKVREIHCHDKKPERL